MAKPVSPLQPLSVKTLRRIMAEFPVHDWREDELAELVAPKYGVITGFSEILEDIRVLLETDLLDIEPAGVLKSNGKK